MSNSDLYRRILNEVDISPSKPKREGWDKPPDTSWFDPTRTIMAGVSAAQAARAMSEAMLGIPPAAIDMKNTLEEYEHNMKRLMGIPPVFIHRGNTTPIIPNITT